VLTYIDLIIIVLMSSFGFRRKYENFEKVESDRIETSTLSAQTASLNPLGLASSISKRFESAASFTLTPQEALSTLLIINTDGRGGGSVTTTASFPTAASLVAAFPGVTVGSTWELRVKHVSQNVTGAETLVLDDASDGISFYNESDVNISSEDVMDIASIPWNGGGVYLLEFTNVSSGTEAVTIYSIGSMLEASRTDYRLSEATP